MSDPRKRAELWFHERATHYVEAQALFHLNQTGVMRMLFESEAPLAAQDIAEKCSLNPEILRVLLEYITGVDALLQQHSDGTFEVTEFGRAVAARYGKHTSEGLQLNLFDVRVGAYGPVWENLGGMLTGEKVYGDNLHRAGHLSERGLYTSARGMAPALLNALPNAPCPIVEIGVETGLLECVARARQGDRLCGLDRNPNALKKCEELAAKEGVTNLDWVEGDLFDPDTWASQIPKAELGVFYSIHMHEFLAVGKEKMVELVDSLGRLFPGWLLVIIEQPRRHESQKETLDEHLWLYSQSNILIHHLIKNGKILYSDDWKNLLEAGAAKVERVESANYLDYEVYSARLGQGS